jgi:hypothetical protein
MTSRIKTLGLALTVLGLIFVAGGFYAFTKVQAGADSLQAFSAVQNVNLSYNEEGQLVDRGDPEQAQTILTMLKEDWGYPVNESELNPNDPLVNTGTEYMYQMATVSYHTLHATTTVTLADDVEDVEYNGVTYHGGDTVEFVNDGRYWTGFDRTNPIEGAAREKIWTGTAHALIAELGVGSVTASTLQMGLGLAGFMGGVGLTTIVLGLGLVWAASGSSAPATVTEKPKAQVAPAKPKAKKG